MDFQLENILETAVCNQVDKLIGVNDKNLNAILKMSILSPNNEEVLEKMRENNRIVKYYVEKEFELTYDNNGEVVFISDINKNEEKGNCEEKSSTDTGVKLSSIQR
jgi:hypothetical protein